MSENVVAPAVAESVARSNAALEQTTMRRVGARLLPLLLVLFICNVIDRTNLAVAALQMNPDLHLSATAYSFGAGIFYVGYAIFEVPSNLILARVGARRWIARIMISWGVVASAMMFVRTPLQFYSLRLLLGIAEAGFFPGVVYYLSKWFPVEQRARALSRFVIAVPLSGAIGNPISGWLLGLDGRLGLAGWQWVFLLEGIPSVVLGFIVLAALTDRPEDARWLSAEQRAWLVERIGREGRESAAPRHVSSFRALSHPIIWSGMSMYFLTMISTGGYLFWAPILIRDTLGASNLMTGLATGAIGCVAAVIMLALGASSDRTGDRFFHMSGAALTSAVGYAGAAFLPSPIARAACLVLVLAGSQGFGIAFWCLPTLFLRGSAAAAGIALINSVANLGQFAGPLTVGVLKDATASTTPGLVALAGVGLGLSGLCLFVRSRPVFALAGRGMREPPFSLLEPSS